MIMLSCMSPYSWCHTISIFIYNTDIVIGCETFISFIELVPLIHYTNLLDILPLAFKNDGIS